jgi:hypothetical protein
VTDVEKIKPPEGDGDVVFGFYHETIIRHPEPP